MRNTFQNFTGKPAGKKFVGIPWSSWVYNIGKIPLKYFGF
jgi:hypothetical protein